MKVRKKHFAMTVLEGKKNETGHKTLRTAVVLLSEGRVNEN